MTTGGERCGIPLLQGDSLIFIEFTWLTLAYIICFYRYILRGYKMKRDCQINIRLSEFEFWRAVEACEYLDVTVSQVCRRALREVASDALAKGWNPEVPIEIQALK